MAWRDLLADALTALGEYDEAESVLKPLMELAQDRRHHSTLAAASRAYGNMLAARQAPEAAHQAFSAGLEHVAQVPHLFERARLRLDHGTFLRRTGRRAAALAELEEAHHLLTGLGAAPFLVRCERELAACGRPVAADGPLPGRLTPQELAVGRLAASGMTNRRIARELILSVKTVEYHLGNAYAKLGIGSRVGLAAALGPE
jgi:DNA-binding NarL/FixJ family response regulator